MLLWDQIRAAVFVTAVLTVYALSLLLLAGRTREWYSGRPRPRSPRRRFLEIGVLGLAALGLACMAYGCFVEPYWPEVTHVRLESVRLGPGARPIRVVLVSDLHSDPEPRLEERLPHMVAAEHPDLILFGGDTINSPQALPVFQKCLTALSKLAPVYAVQGNWDVAYWQGIDLLGGTGAEELTGFPVELEI